MGAVTLILLGDASIRTNNEEIQFGFRTVKQLRNHVSRSTDARFDLEPAAPVAVPRPLVRFGSVEHWHLDAKCRRGMADDLAGAKSDNGGAGASGNESAGFSRRLAGGGRSRSDRPSTAVVGYSGLDAGRG